MTVSALVDLIAREVTQGEPVRLRAQYHLQLEAAEHPELQPLVRSWFETTVARTAEVLARLGSATPDLDARLVTAATVGPRLNALTVPPTDQDEPVLRPALARMIASITDLAG